MYAKRKKREREKDKEKKTYDMNNDHKNNVFCIFNILFLSIELYNICLVIKILFDALFCINLYIK